MKEIRLPSMKIIISVTTCIVAIIAVIYLAYLSHKHYEQIVISQTQQQLLSTARATARSIEQFVKEHSRALKTFSTDPVYQEAVHYSIMHKFPDAKFCPVKNYYEVHKDNVDGLALIDSKGIMLHRHPFIENLPGMDLTDELSIANVIKEQKPYISHVIRNFKDKLAISISEPIFF